jgi:aryl-alcohol dehydrogenase-like predicted oxidoreductase
MLYRSEASDRAIVDAVGEIATQRGVARAQIALAWLRICPVVVAPIVGAMKTSHIDDAIAALSLTLSDDEAARLEAPYTPRCDFQGVSDPRELARISAAVGIEPAGA